MGLQTPADRKGLKGASAFSRSMGMVIDWFDIGLAAGLIASIALIAYVWMKNRELAQTVIEEKNTILEFTIPILEEIKDILPPDKQAKVAVLLEGLKLMHKINEALAQVPASKLRKAWLTYKVQLSK